MIKNRKQLFLIIGSFLVVLMLFTTTFAFFNYTRTGVSNVIKVGRIYFNSEQTTINLNNVFPIDSANVNTDTDNVGVATIHITGDTTYSGGIEYLVSAVDVNNTINNKTLPISIDVNYDATNNNTIGTRDSDYFTNRGGNTSIYNIIAKNIKNNSDELVVGYIAKGQTGIDGVVTIKAFLDKDKIAISDTYSGGAAPGSYIVNPNASETDIANCVTYFSNMNAPLQSGESYEAVCRGNGTLHNYTLLDLVNFFEDDLLNMNIIILADTLGETSSEWVNGRTVFTTTEWNSLQENGISFKIKVEANEGPWVTPVGNAMNNIPQVFSQNNINQNIKEIYFNKMNESEMHQRYDASTIKANITYNDEGEVLAWLEENPTDNTKYNMYIVSTGTTFLENCSGLFSAAGLTYVNKIEFNNVDTSRVTTMADLFSGMTLNSLDISSFDTSNVTDISSMFSGTTINNIDLRTLNLSNVQRMDGTFYNSTIGTVNMSNMNLSSLTSVSAAFSSSNITNVYLNGVNAPNIDYATTMFGGSNITNLDMSDMVLTNLYSMNYMFAGATITNLDFGDEFDVSNVTDMTSTFASINISTLDLSAWKTNSLQSLHSTFDNCKATTLLFGENFKTNNVTDMGYTFQSSRATTLDLSNFDTSNVTGMWYAFSNTRATTIYVSDLWDTSDVYSSTSVFSEAAVVGEQGTKPYESCTVENDVQTCTNQLNTFLVEYARIDNPPDSPGYFTYKAHS